MNITKNCRLYQRKVKLRLKWRASQVGVVKAVECIERCDNCNFYNCKGIGKDLYTNVIANLRSAQAYYNGLAVFEHR